jgi:DSF synthase
LTVIFSQNIAEFAKVQSELYPDFEFNYEKQFRSIWINVRFGGPVRATENFVRKLTFVQSYVAQLQSSSECIQLEYCISASSVPSIYNFGGDLPFFIQCIRENNVAALKKYAHACTRMIFNNSIGWGSEALTVALVQGDALGGGFESAISHDFIVAERSVKMGMPEIVFNTFPGMGAYSYLCRKLDAARAERMILSGKIYTAAELYDMGLVNVLAEDGQGRDAVQRLISDTRRAEVLRSLKRVRQRILPLDLQELLDVTDIWVENVMKIQPSDLRRMEKLVSAQERRIGTIVAPVG